MEVCMKKTFILLSLFLLSSVIVGCSFSLPTTTTSETTSNSISETTTVTTTTISTTSTIVSTTTDPRYQVLNQEFDYLSPMIPEAMISDYTLPELNNAEITSYVSLDGVLLTSSIIPYTASALDLYCTLSITLIYQDISLSKDFSIIMLRDSHLYQLYLIDQTFLELKAMIDYQIPDVIESDFTLPYLDNPDATISFTTSISKIYNHRFIFSFPFNETDFTITARIRYSGQTRTYQYPITMKGLNQLSQIPTIYIYTDNSAPITSKIDYIHGTFSMVVYDSNLIPTNILNNQSILIRGRGNSTFYMPKQSFKLKFENKTSLLFDYWEHDWVLLANYADQTLIRNYLAYTFAGSITEAFEPTAAFVDVYLNDVFLGNYTLTDQMEVTNDRINVEEHSTDEDTGFLVEFDRRQWDWPDAIRDKEWFVIDGIPYVIKSPKYEDGELSVEQFNFIGSYMALCYNTLVNKGDYTNLIDEESFIDWFIVQELFKNVDSGYASVFLMKDKGGKLQMGPVWDFDLSTSNPGHLQDNLRGPEGWYTSLQYKNTWFYYLMKYDTFRQHLKEKWNAIYDVQIKDLIESVYPLSDSIAKSRYRNFQVWDVIGINYEWYTSTEVYNAKTYEEQVYILYNYLLVRSIWLNNAINEF